MEKNEGNAVVLSFVSRPLLMEETNHFPSSLQPPNLSPSCLFKLFLIQLCYVDGGCGIEDTDLIIITRRRHGAKKERVFPPPFC